MISISSVISQRVRCRLCFFFFLTKLYMTLLMYTRGLHYQNHPIASECQKSGKIWAAFEPSSEPFEFSSDRQDRSGFGSRPAATRCVHTSVVELHWTRWRGRGDVLLSKFRCGTDELSWIELQSRQQLQFTAPNNSYWQLVFHRV